MAAIADKIRSFFVCMVLTVGRCKNLMFYLASMLADLYKMSSFVLQNDDIQMNYIPNFSIDSNDSICFVSDYNTVFSTKILKGFFT